ncbi:hypothetical protein CC80DRAFT_541953 [Byssothecium circinans]|uniref:Uncharacterized protein n=1 Tax=Byssothecium circinans TaxID=147558 RepID=A0A6A5UGB1_9PLEO|nr:hypothetical protein CC80DRAFT_541953 [Byssothecium circinans]
MLLSGYIKLYLTTLFSLLLITLIYTLYAVYQYVTDQPISHRPAPPLVWAAFIVIIYIILPITLLACCEALAHQERCAMLESYNFGKKKEKSREFWTKWVTGGVGTYYRVMPAFGRYAFGPWFWREVWRMCVRYIGREKDEGKAKSEESRWEWAEEREIGRVEGDGDDELGGVNGDLEARH